MAKRATLSSVPSYLPGTTSSSAINASDDALNAAFDNTISRDGSTPNQMTADLDLNSNDILNVNELNVGTLKIDGTSATVLGSLPLLHGVRVWRSTTQSFNNSTAPVLFDKESYQLVDGSTVTTMHSTSSNTERLITDVAGYWIAEGQVVTDSLSVEFNWTAASITLNGTTNVGHSSPGASEASGAHGGTDNDARMAVQVSSGRILLAKDDYVTLNFGIIPINNLSRAGEFRTFFSLHLVAPA